MKLPIPCANKNQGFTIFQSYFLFTYLFIYLFIFFFGGGGKGGISLIGQHSSKVRLHILYILILDLHFLE